MKNLIFTCFLAISNCLFAQPGVTIKVQDALGNAISVIWDKSFLTGSDLTEAGNDYVGTYESEPNATYIKIASVNKNIDYKVLIHREYSADWDSKLDLQIKWIKTFGNGSTGGSTSYTSIPLTDNFFYYTIGNSNTDQIQFKIKGISVLLPAKVYQTTVVFTVMNRF